MAGAPSDFHPRFDRDHTSNPLDPWGRWILRWFGATLTVSILAIVLILAADPDWPVGSILLFAFPITLLVGGLTLFASGARWLLSRFAPPQLQGALVPVIGVGVLAGLVPLWLFFFGGSLPDLTATGLRDSVATTVPAGIGGGVASYLAERQVSARGRRWWLTTLVAGVGAGLVSVWVWFG
ncbi:hypothetical protein [Egicoccus sp. AB-alg2]|uniref:hypothetical protein n=1 Tax=Egicoccus sp. AB-alg2 TaxID=3242693 RepID=UPI00359E3D27